MRNVYKNAVAGLALGVVAGCASSGTGTGKLVQRGGAPEGAVSFSWHTGMNPDRGELTATLPNGQTYMGRFFEVTTNTDLQTLTPLWEGWSPWWTDWPWAPYAYAGQTFMTSYTGRVLATLSGPGGKRMRCRFFLATPEAGMPGGGQGKCQFQDGSTIDANFPPG